MTYNVGGVYVGSWVTYVIRLFGGVHVGRWVTYVIGYFGGVYVGLWVTCNRTFWRVYVGSWVYNIMCKDGSGNLVSSHLNNAEGL